MKKIVLLLTFLISLYGISATYTVTQNKGVKVDKTVMEKNNAEIENILKKEMAAKYISTKEEIDETRKRTVDPLASGELFIDIENIDDALFSYRYTQMSLMEIFDKMNTGYEISKINYISPEKAQATVILKGPDVKTLNEMSINKKAEEEFKARTGYSINEAADRKWKAGEEVKAITELYKITIKILAENLNSLKSTDKKTILIHLDKKGGLWEVVY